MTIRVAGVGCAAAALATCLGLSAAATAMAEPVVTASLGNPSAVTVDPVLGGRTLTLSASKLPRWGGLRSSHSALTSSAAWRDMLAQVGNVSGQALYDRVNRLVNQVRYVDDRGDTWRAPAEFFRKGGDCEDYAIAKYMLLKAKGVPVPSMRILMIPATGGQLGHSILVVQTGRGPIVLDNRRSGTYPLSRGLSARATYAFNDSTWWVNLDGGRLVAAR